MAKKVKRAWYTQIVSGDTMTGIVEITSQTIDGVTDEWKTLTESGLKINVELSMLNADLTNPSSTWVDIASRYHKSIVDKAIAMDCFKVKMNVVAMRGLNEDELVDFADFEGSGRIIPQDF